MTRWKAQCRLVARSQSWRSVVMWMLLLALLTLARLLGWRLGTDIAARAGLVVHGE